MPDIAGKKLGEFEVHELLGVGALGRVYRAVQMPFRRPVALKVLEQGLFTPDDTVERFRREAEAMARMEHPHILPIYSAGTVPPFHFIAMRLVRDGTLDDRITKGAHPDLPTAVGWLRQVVWALSHAHGRGVVHRDIKPSNILIADGIALLGDFGIARLRELSTITETGSLIGTPLYMSPEQVRGEKAEAPSDLFSIGVVLYELATRVHPFYRPEEKDLPISERQTRLFGRITESQFPPPRAAKTDLPPILDQILGRCLRKEPALRYASAVDLLKDLNLAQVELGYGDVPGGRNALTMLPEGADAGGGVRAPTGDTRFFRRASKTPPGGKPFGRYLLYQEVGHGATGVVYRGLDPDLDRPVAVKILRAGKDAKPLNVEMFRHEARVAARLNHPHIVDVYDAGILDGQAFLVMEFVPGPSLDRVVLAQGALPLRFALEIVRQALLALRAAHDAGIVHLDVKPGNILLRSGAARDGKEGPFRLSDPYALLGDFTLAKLGMEPHPAPATPPAPAAPPGSGRDGGAATRGPTSIMGTPAYMSPEQAEGLRDALDARSDVFSLGAVTYHLLAGKPPFAAGTPESAVLRAAAGRVEPLGAARPDLPADVEALCARALQRDRAARFQSAQEFLAAVEGAMQALPKA